MMEAMYLLSMLSILGFCGKTKIVRANKDVSPRD